jgi:hypothetical protein
MEDMVGPILRELELEEIAMVVIINPKRKNSISNSDLIDIQLFHILHLEGTF